MNLKELIFGGGVTGVSDRGGAYAGSVQAWLPVKDIIKGVVLTRDKRFIKIVELLPVNFYTMSELEKGSAIADLAAYLKIAPSNLQINVLTQKFDLNSYMKMLRGALERERNERCREMIEESMAYVPQLVEREAITHRFFLSFSYDPNEIDLTLPGKKPCAYFCCISAQDSSLEFLSSLFFSQLFTRLMDYGRRHGDHGRLPVTVNVCLEEFCNIGKLMDFKRVLNVCRGSAIFCQIIVQSIPQLQDRYPKTEWEELIGCTDIQICLGCNDVDTATYISKKCGMVTIKVENNQMPLMPLFSPVYTSTRPYSQTKSSTQRPLMYPDEIMRMDNQECLVLLRGQKPLRLYKIIPDEHPSFGRLRDVRVSDYIPHWRQEEGKPKAKPAPSPKPSCEQEEVPPPSSSTGSPPPSQEDAAPPTPDSAPPPKTPGEWGPKYDYGLLDPVDGFDGAGQEPDSGQDARYGGFDLIETEPQNVGGEQNEGQR